MAAEEKLGVPSNEFFAAVKYHAVGSLQDQSEELLKAGGATAKAYLSDDVTHCLAGQAAEEDVLQEASEIYEIPVIRGDAWVQKSIKCGKPLPLSVFDAVPSKAMAFFKGLHFSLSGLSYKDMSNIWTIVSAYGGTVSREVRAKTTHLICGAKSGLKYEKAEKVIKVTPDFILECVRAKCLVPAETFHPRLLLQPGEIWEKPQAKKVKKKRPETEMSQVSQVTEPPVPQVPVPSVPVTTATPQAPPAQIAGQNNVPKLSQPNVSQPMSQGQLPGQNSAPRMSQPNVSQQGQNNVPRMSQPMSQPNRMQMGPRPQMTQAGQRPPMPMGQRTPMSQAQVPPGQNPQMSQAGQQMNPMNPQMSQAGHMPANPQMSQAGQMPANPQMSQAGQMPTPAMSQAGQMSTPPMSQAGQMSTPPMSQGSGTMPNMSQANQMPAMSQPGQMTPQMSQPNQMPPQMSQANQMQQQMGQPGQMSHQMGQQPQMSQAGAMPMQQQQQQQQQPGQYPQQQPQQMMQYQQNPQQYPQQQQQQQQYQWQGQQQQYQGQYPQQQQNWQQQQAQQQQQQPPRPSNPIMLRQQQLIHQHIASLSIEDRAKFTSMTPHEKQEYLAQRNLLVTNQMMQQTTIVLTDQQREQLQHMDQPQKAAFIQRLRQQQAMRQQQQQQQQQQYQQQPQPQGQNYQVRPPHSSPQQPNPQLSPGNRPQWSGETHPALAQVPRTPQQLQHLQRLQMQREQQQLSPNQQQMVRPQLPQQPGVPQPQVPNQVPGQNGSQQKTKVALQNMLSNRAMSPQQVAGGPQPQPQSPQRLQMPPQQPPVIPQPQQQMQPQQPPQVPQVQQAQPQVPQPQMFPQPQRPQFMQAQQQPMVQPQVPVQRPPGVPQGPMMVAQPQPQPHIRYGPPGGPQMQAAVPQPVARPQMTPQPPRPPMPRPMFLGHQPGNNLPPDLCLLGCIFFICDYQDDLEDSKFCDDWKKVIRQFGGEVVDTYHAGITHVLCKAQDSNLANQALREGKRLVTVYWLNDIVVKRVVLPPWKAIHFPLPANFERPCENMILTLTGFEGRDRDWVKEMIRITGAKYTSYFTKHNHAIICKSCEGDKYAKAKEWKVPTVSIQWLNDVFFGSMNAVQCMNNPKYQNFRAEDPFKIEYSLVPNLMASWKNPIRITPETFNKVKANPPARIKRKAEKKRLEEEEAKRLRRADENQSAIDPTTGQFIPPNQPQPNPHQQSSTETTEVKNEVKSPEIKAESNGKMNGVKENGDNCDVEKDSNEKDENKLKIMLSGFVESEKEELTGLVQGLGMELTDIAQKATHLVMPKLGRTISFLCAISYVKYILKADWIRESSKEKKVLDVKDFRLQDSDFEKTFGCNLTKMLAKQDRHKLFEGRTFYLTPSIKPTWKQLKLVIECAGGKVENKRRKKVDEIREISGNSGESPVYLIITCEHDLHIVTDVLKAKIGIFNAEFVMSAVMKGKMDFDLTRSITTV